MRRPPHVLQSLLLLLVMVVAIAAADHCPDSQQPQPAFGSSRHLVGLVVFATCELLDQAVKPSPAEVRRYLQDATDTADDDQIDWHANYSCPEDGQDDAYPAAVSRQLSPAASSQDTVFDLPVAVAAAAADCFSEAAGERACAACADALHLRARLRAALSARAGQLHDAVARAAAPHSCSSGAGVGDGDGEDDACTEWRRQRTPLGLSSVSVPAAAAAEAALRLWGRLCASAPGCCGAPGHALTVRDQLARFQAALDDATAESLQRAVGDALGAARQVGGRARLGAAAAARLEAAERQLGAALRDLRQVVRAARDAQRQALGAQLLAGGCAPGPAGAAAAEAAAWALARAAVGGAAARLLGGWGGAAPGARLTARRGLRALQLALCRAQRLAAAAAQLSDTVAGMLAHSAHQPVAADEAQPASAASQQTANCAALLVSAAALHPARFLV